MLWLSQEKCATKVLQRFNMYNAKLVGFTLSTKNKLNVSQCPKSERDKAKMRQIPYALAVKNLMYAMVCIRLDIVYVVGTVSHYMSNPRKAHWAIVKWVLKYMKGTFGVCLRYNLGKPVLEGFTYSDMSVDVNTN